MIQLIRKKCIIYKVHRAFDSNNPGHILAAKNSLQTYLSRIDLLDKQINEPLDYANILQLRNIFPIEQLFYKNAE